jgi:hypothetical protein
MYRIELSPGEQTAFRSIEELAVAIRRGIVTPQARIWHNASNKWLPIQFHPHYKVAASMQLTPAELVQGPPVKPLELLTLGELMDPPVRPVRPPAEPRQPARHKERPREPVREVRAAQPAREVRATQPEPPAPKKRAKKSRRPRSVPRSFRMGLAGALLIAGAQLIFTAVSAARPENLAARPLTHRRLVAAPAPYGEQGRPGATAAAVLPGLPAVTHPIRAGSVAPPQPAMAATSSLGASPAETAPDIERAPPTNIAPPTTVNTDSLAPTVTDTSGRKALKGVLRAIGGTGEGTRPTR